MQEFTKVLEKMSYHATISAHENKNHSKNLNQKSVPYDMNRVNLLANDIGYVYVPVTLFLTNFSSCAIFFIFYLEILKQKSACNNFFIETITSMQVK